MKGISTSFRGAFQLVLYYQLCDLDQAQTHAVKICRSVKSLSQGSPGLHLGGVHEFQKQGLNLENQTVSNTEAWGSSSGRQ